MIKVKLQHALIEAGRVHLILSINAIQIIRTNLFGDITTCIFKDQDELRKVLVQLNEHTRLGVSIQSQRKLFTFKNFINWWRS